MRLFRLDEYCWYCGSDADEAIAAYMADTGINREEATDDMFFGEVTGDDLDRMIIDTEDESNNQTMRAAVAAMTAPGFVCGIDA
jgi:hypothetical protein